MTTGPYGDGLPPSGPYGYPTDQPGLGYPSQVHQSQGYPPLGQYPQAYPPPGAVPMGYGAYPQPRNGLGTAALVLGIIGVVFCWVPFTGWALNILAIVFGAVGRKRAVEGLATNRSSAVAGLVLGVIGLTVWIVIVIIAVAAVSSVNTVGYFSR